MCDKITDKNRYCNNSNACAFAHRGAYPCRKKIIPAKNRVQVILAQGIMSEREACERTSTILVVADEELEWLASDAHDVRSARNYNDAEKHHKNDDHEDGAKKASNSRVIEVDKEA